MKIITGYLIVVCLLVFSTICYAKEPIIIVSDDYEPYTSSKNKGSGVILDVVRQAFDKVQIEVVFEFYPWNRCERMVEKGRAFAAAPYFKTKERLEKYDFSDPIVHSINRFFYNKEKFPNGFEWKTLKDFQGYHMGGVRGYWYMPAFERAGLETEIVPSDLQNLGKIIYQRIDFTIIDELTGMQLLYKHYPKEVDKIDVLEKPESFSPFYLLISKTYPDTAGISEKFSQGLKILKEKNSYKNILKHYNIPEHFIVP